MVLKRQCAWRVCSHALKQGGLVALFFALCAPTPTPAHADGKFFRHLQVADEPGIAAQRAILAYRDGVETLVVQSDVTGDGESFGWVLPLPAAPTSIEACAANELKAVAQSLSPQIVRTRSEWLLFAGVLFLVTLIAAREHLRPRTEPREPLSVCGIVLALLALFIAISVFLPSLSTAGRGLTDATVLQHLRAGVYDVSVISGQSGESVEAWLADNGFACPPTASSVIAEYVQDGWCFLTARVAGDSAGAVTHHPLRVTFPVSQPVYPMRLTGSGGNPVVLDLFVIGQRQAAADGLGVWHCDTYAEKVLSHSFDHYRCEVPPHFVGQTYPGRVSVPAASDLMWPQCVVTRLHGRLDAAQMDRDLVLTWHDPQPRRAALYSVRAAAGQGGVAALLVAAIGVGWSARDARRRGWTAQTLAERRGPALILGALAAGGLTYVWLDVVPVRDGRADRFAGLGTLAAQTCALRKTGLNPPGQPFPEAFRDGMVSCGYEDLPEPSARPAEVGDYRIEPDGDGWRLTIIDEWFVPVTIPIDRTGRPWPSRSWP